MILNRTRAFLSSRTPSLYHVTRGGGCPDTRHCSRILCPRVWVRDVALIFARGRRPVHIHAPFIIIIIISSSSISSSSSSSSSISSRSHRSTTYVDAQLTAQRPVLKATQQGIAPVQCRCRLGAHWRHLRNAALGLRQTTLW